MIQKPPWFLAYATVLFTVRHTLVHRGPCHDGMWDSCVMQVLFLCTPAQANVSLLICYAHSHSLQAFLDFSVFENEINGCALVCKLTFGMWRYLKGGKKPCKVCCTSLLISTSSTQMLLDKHCVKHLCHF